MSSWRTCHFLVLDVVPELEVRFVPRLLTQLRCTQQMKWTVPYLCPKHQDLPFCNNCFNGLRLHWILNPDCYGTADHFIFHSPISEAVVLLLWATEDHLEAEGGDLDFYKFKILSVSPWESIVHSRTWSPIYISIRRKYIIKSISEGNVWKK